MTCLTAPQETLDSTQERRSSATSASRTDSLILVPATDAGTCGLPAPPANAAGSCAWQQAWGWTQGAGSRLASEAAARPNIPSRLRSA